MGEDEIADSPMARMRSPAVPDEPPPVLRLEELERLLAVCAGTSFEDRRDTAIIRRVPSSSRLRSTGPPRSPRSPTSAASLASDVSTTWSSSERSASSWEAPEQACLSG